MARRNQYGRRGREPKPKEHVARSFDLQAGGDATIVVIADTHSRPHEDARKHIAAHKPDIILHAGDIGELSVIDSFVEIAPTVTVRGNIDGHEYPDTALVRVQREGTTLLRLVMTHIALWGPRLRKDARILAGRHRAQLVICGHSHVPFAASQAGLTVFNPGSIGPRRAPLPITFGVMTMSEKGLSLKHVDCETGERWSPPRV